MDHSRPRARAEAPGPIEVAARERGAERSSSLVKALDIVETTVREPASATTAEVAARLGLPKPTAHRIVNSLRELGFLQRESGSGRLVEGSRLVALALDVLASATRRGPRHNILEALADETGETCNLGVMAAGQVVYIDRVETKWPLGLRFDVGSTVPIHCTAIGKMFLSQMPDRLRRKYLGTLPLTRYTENTRTDAESLEEDLERIRSAGVSFDNCEFMSGVVCIAVPIRGRNGRTVAGLALSAPEARLTVDEARRHIPALRDVAGKLALTFDDDP